jgi:hemoglobin
MQRSAMMQVEVEVMENQRKRIYGDLGTLYARCGGIFGVSAFADRCMDQWMADSTLNANQAVATWHHLAQRCGFKFLVVQIIGNLTGGPQQYTGRPLDRAHKHLNISEDEWSKFMVIFNDVCAEFGLPGETVDDLNALMISMEEDCVTYPGDHVPPNPGAYRPSGPSLYARLGGVYPLALFSDRLVDAILEDSRIEIPRDSHKRNEASLKYLFTEVVCHITGGPEIITAQDSDETKLLVPRNCWDIFILTAEIACDHLPAAHRPALIQTFHRNRALVVDINSPTTPQVAGGPCAVKSLQQAAAGKQLSKATIAARHAAPGAFVAARRRVFGDPRTVYGRGGGIFGLAKVSDILMDRWMENPALNANTMVNRWHESQQKYGFKFLVTQIMGYLTGGPQRYTGRSMAAAHKHLSITPAQWEAFMQDARNVLTELGVESGAKNDLIDIIQSFRSDCVVAPGEVAPADPGRPKPAAGSEGTLYYRLGGVYPIAQFVDRLVEAVLKGDRVKIDLDNVEDPQSKRHAAGLKYMLTELTCNCTGGPEIITSKGFDDAKLGVPAEQWPTFLELANEAATLWPSQLLRTSLLNALADQKAEICIGIVGDDDSVEAEAMRKIQVAGFGHFEATAALDKCRGDPSKALELLIAGWSPGQPQSVTQLGDVNTDAAAAAGYGAGIPARCPFSGALAPSNVASPQRCPFGFGASAPAAPAAPPTPTASQLDDRTTEAARTLAERGIPASQIAILLQVDEAAVNAAIRAAEGAHVGRVIGSSLQQKLDDLLTEDTDLCCPISLVLLSEPVVASDGFMYEKASLEELLRTTAISPMTRQSLKTQFFPAVERKKKALEFRELRSMELLDFADEVIKAGQQQMAIEAAERVADYINALPHGSCASIDAKLRETYVKLGRPAPVFRRTMQVD